MPSSIIHQELPARTTERTAERMLQSSGTTGEGTLAFEVAFRRCPDVL